MKEDGSEALYTELIMAFVPGIMQFLFGKEQSQEEDLRLEGLKPVLSVSKNWLFRSFLNLFESLLLGDDTRESYIEKQNEAKEKQEINLKKTALHRSKSHLHQMDDEEDEEAAALQRSLSRKATIVTQKWFDTMDPQTINKTV